MKAKKPTIREMIASRNKDLKQQTGHLPKLRRSYKRKYSGERLQVALDMLDAYKLRCTINRDISVVRLRIALLKRDGKPESRELNGEIRLLQGKLSEAIRQEGLAECKRGVLDGNHEHMYMSISTPGFHRSSCPFGLPISKKVPVKA